MNTIIAGLGMYLPEKVVTNDDLSASLNTSHEWIHSRTGISSRHLVSNGELASDLGFQAALQSLENTGIKPEDIDAIVVSTTTSDHQFPSCAAKIQGLLGAKKAFAFDIAAACCGFVYGLTIVDSLIKSMQLKNVLLIASETLSLFVDWTDRSTCVLFGDGAGALLLQPETNESTSQSGIIATKLYCNASDGKFDFILSKNGEQNDHRGYIEMMGKSVFKYAIEYMSDACEAILLENNMTMDDIDWIIPHQANKRIIEAMVKMREIPESKLIITTDTHANTSSASIPLALKESINCGKIKKGDTILVTALGAGLVWGSAILRV